MLRLFNNSETLQQAWAKSVLTNIEKINKIGEQNF